VLGWQVRLRHRDDRPNTETYDGGTPSASSFFSISRSLAGISTTRSSVVRVGLHVASNRDAGHKIVSGVALFCEPGDDEVPSRRTRRSSSRRGPAAEQLASREVDAAAGPPRRSTAPARRLPADTSPTSGTGPRDGGRGRTRPRWGRSDNPMATGLGEDRGAGSEPLERLGRECTWSGELSPPRRRSRAPTAGSAMVVMPR